MKALYSYIFILMYCSAGLPCSYAQVEKPVENVALQGTLQDKTQDVGQDNEEESVKNPFKPYTSFNEEASVAETPVVNSEETPKQTVENKFDYSSLKVTGTVWGNDKPKAIINDKVVGIGDVVDDAKIINITKDGILFEYKDKQYLMNREGSAVK